MKKSVILLVAGVALTWGGLAVKLWWLGVVTGLLIALLSSTRKQAVWLSVGAGALGWAIPLGLQYHEARLFQLSSLLGQIIGLGSSGLYVVICLPIFLGVMITLLGAWVGRTASFLLPVGDAASRAQNM